MRKIGVIFTIAALLACSASFAVAVTVTGVTSDHANGTFGLGEVVHVQVTFSESVTYTAGSGGFGIQLETGVSDRTAAYLSGYPGAVLTFTYTVQSTDSTADLDYKATNSLALTGNAALVDTATGLVNATLTLATPGAANSLGANKALVIDGIVPTCTINQAVAQVDPTYGTTINFTVVTSESTSNFATGDVTLTGTAGATTGR